MKKWNVTGAGKVLDSKEESCCGDGGTGGIPEMSGEQACECIEQDVGHRVIPLGTIKLAGQERRYKTTTNLLLTRDEFLDWSASQGSRVDPVVYFTEMGHPLPPDVKL